MNILITVEVHVPEAIQPRQVADEVTSNVESCGWTVVSMRHEVIEPDAEVGGDS